MHCRTHHAHFTVYPPGHFPWGQQAIVQVPTDGSVPRVVVAADQDDVPAVFEDTLFEPAWEAAHERLWSSECDRAGETWRSVQVRKVDDTVRLVGVADTVNDAGRDAVHAELLGVATQLLRDARRSIAQEPGLISRARAVIRIVLTVLRAGGPFVNRLTAAGYRARLWGRPFRWMSNTSRLLALAT